MRDLSGWVRYALTIAFRPQRTAHLAVKFAQESSKGWVRTERERCRYQRALQAIRDAAPTRSTYYALADAALRGEPADERR